MSSITKRDSGAWRARYRDEGGREHARHFKRKVDAQRWLDEVTASKVTGVYVDPRAGKITFAQWYAQWSARQVWVAGTVTAAQLAASSVPFADQPMRSIRASHVQAWVKAMVDRGLAPSTIKTRHAYVHMAFRAAVLERVLSVDPTASVRLPRVRRAEAAMTIPTTAEVGAALSAAPEYFRAFIAVCAFAGLRLGEAAGLQAGDVDTERRTITVARQVQGDTRKHTQAVAPKHGSERVVFIPEALASLLGSHAALWTWGEECWLFGTGSLLGRANAGHLWRMTRKAAGLSADLTLHDLRHFYASGLIAQGCDVVTVQRALGHSSATITLGVYSHLWPTAEDRTRAAAAELLADSMRTVEDA